MTAANANADLAPRMPVEVETLAYTFIGRDRPSLRDISFSLPVATWTLVAGRTGSGKSTLLRAQPA
jgi:energy-coupling factor transporter ATP-binding protein EcfA2